jgi:hypothetical protein
MLILLTRFLRQTRRARQNPLRPDIDIQQISAESYEQSFQVVIAGFINFAPLNPNEIDGYLPLFDKFIQIETEGTNVLSQLRCGFLERHENARFVVVGSPADEKLRRQQSLAGACAAANQCGSAPGKSSTGDLVESLNACPGLRQATSGCTLFFGCLTLSGYHLHYLSTLALNLSARESNYADPDVEPVYSEQFVRRLSLIHVVSGMNLARCWAKLHGTNPALEGKEPAPIFLRNSGSVYTVNSVSWSTRDCNLASGRGASEDSWCIASSQLNKPDPPGRPSLPRS